MRAVAILPFSIFSLFVWYSMALADGTGLMKVPFVGCAADGQSGKIAAPEDDGHAPFVEAQAAADLAFYKPQDGIGVLAPRGWYCFDFYGSSGSFLVVSPSPPSDFLATNAPKIAGFGVEFSFVNGDNSGRFMVAQDVARMMPAYHAFVQSVIDEDILPAKDFPSGPYPHDKLFRHNNHDVSFATPALRDGMGTNSLFVKGNFPIQGEMIVDIGPTVDPFEELLTMRLPPRLDVLAPVLFQAFQTTAYRKTLNNR
jgi:hypothetical protein